MTYPQDDFAARMFGFDVTVSQMGCFDGINLVNHQPNQTSL
jgi:hypothetical protein